MPEFLLSAEFIILPAEIHDAWRVIGQISDSGTEMHPSVVERESPKSRGRKAVLH